MLSKMTPHYSFNVYHIGDQMAHLQFLRKMAVANPQHEWIHFMHEMHLTQLIPVVEDIPTIDLRPLECEQGKKAQDGQFVDADGKYRARNVWKNAGGYWENHEFRNDYTNFYIAWFAKLAAEMGLLSPIMPPANLLFDYPKLLEPAWPGEEFDYLVINSRPCSGQFLAYDRLLYFDPLLEAIVKSGASVAVTQYTGVTGVRVTTASQLTLTQIGNVSLRCKKIIGVGTAPWWATCNLWAKPERRIIMLDCGEIVDFDGKTEQAKSLAQAADMLGVAL
jgi:hypothetical protein